MNVMEAPTDSYVAFQLLEPAWISNTYSSCAATENSGPETALWSWLPDQRMAPC